MLHPDHLTSAPSAVKVSIKTAVCMVICIQPKILAPLRGCSFPYLSLNFIKAGISDWAITISFLPQSANSISATL